MITTRLLLEFCKFATAVRVEDLSPGDVLLTSSQVGPGPRGILSKALNYGQRRTQGHFGHAMMYLGNGEMLDHRIEHGTRIKPAAEAIGDLDHVVIRPRASAASKQRAVAFAKQHVGDAYNKKTMVASGASLLLPKKLRDMVHKPVDPGAHNWICSSIVNAAYDGKLAPERGALAAPIDILHSPRSRVIHSHSAGVPDIPTLGAYRGRKLPQVLSVVAKHLK